MNMQKGAWQSARDALSGPFEFGGSSQVGSERGNLCPASAKFVSSASHRGGDKCGHHLTDALIREIQPRPSKLQHQMNAMFTHPDPINPTPDSDYRPIKESETEDSWPWQFPSVMSCNNQRDLWSRLETGKPGAVDSEQSSRTFEKC